MREIKFRAFVVKERLDDLGSNMHLAGVSQYEVVVDVVDISFSNGAIDYVTDAEGYEYSFTNGNLKSVIQYTGSRDKNGKEIYEGGIVESYHQVYDGGQTNRSVITFNDFCWRLVVNGDKQIANIPLGLYARQPETIAVIGNIYENPELLEEGVSKV